MLRLVTLGVAALLAGCTLGTDEPSSDRAAPPSVAETHRAEVVAALDAALACHNTECTELAFLRAHTDAVLSAIVPLDDALRGTPESKAELERLATATFALRHSALQLQSCFLISARMHDGVPRVSECLAPAGEFRENLEYTRNALSSAK